MTAAQKTDTLVRLFFAGLLSWLSIDRLPWYWATIALVALAWEAWALMNDEPHDTISEAIWRMCDATALAPCGLGFAYGLAIGEKYISDPVVLLALGLLLGHFVFPRYGRNALTGPP